MRNNVYSSLLPKKKKIHTLTTKKKWYKTQWIERNLKQMLITQYLTWLLKTNQQNEIKDKYL